MSLGLAIFLSSLFLGTVALFIATKDLWNWRKLILWPVGISFSLLIFGGIGIYVYSRIPYEPKVEDTFWGISLTASKADTKFIKGAPTEMKGEDLWTYKEQKAYSDDWSIYVIKFEKEKIRYILFTGSDWLSSPDIQGVRLKDSPATVRERFGDPSYISVSDDDLERIYSYDSYNVFFHMKENKVYAYGMYNPQLGRIEFAKKKDTQQSGKAR